MTNATRAVAALMLLVAAIALTLIGLPTPHRLGGHSLKAAILYALIYAVATMLPVPKALFSLTAGIFFGILGGIAITLVGATIGATADFVIARCLGRIPFENAVGARVGWLDDLLDRHGIAAMIGLRLIPLVPFTALNYAAGLTSITTWRYVLATAVGITPGASLYVALGAAGRQPGSWPILVSLVGLAVVWGVVAILVKTGRVSAWRAAKTPVSE